MKISKIKICDFRGYRECEVDFNNLTAFVGKNDIGKSTVIEALDLFFNEGKGIIKFDKDDINVEAKNEGINQFSISVLFSELPERVIIDATNDTAIADEYLLNSDGLLEIKKVFLNGSTIKIYISAFHPTNPECADLLLKKDSELRRIIESQGIECEDRTKNAVMRKAIWHHYGDNLSMSLIDIEVTKGDTKSIWEKLQKYLPIYSLFQADRKNNDNDSEVQDPLKEAVKQILKDEELIRILEGVARSVEEKLRDVSNRTLNKLQEMNPEIANSLNPVIPETSSLKWQDVFKNVSITGDNDIPINKRGSGTKRLVLLNFFRAEAERRLENSESTSIVYAIEEPETSQHADNQKKLIEALSTLSESQNTQVIITTHSSTIVKNLNHDNIRIIHIPDTEKKIEMTAPHLLPYPSLNEVNYVAFSEVTEEYHNELYGYIEEQGLLNSYKIGKQQIAYIRIKRDGTHQNETLTETEYIRNQIHHPENTLNARFTYEQLRNSIEMMRRFIESQP